MSSILKIDTVAEKYFPSAKYQFLACIWFALVIRIFAFGDPAVHIDEAFYLLVGQMMHHGAVPYVDVWDRKPLGLFVIYYVLSTFTLSPIPYQIAATISAASTAFLINRMAGRISGRLGAMLAAMLYLAACNALQGGGGQAPIFYNLFICTAFWLVARNLQYLRSGSVPAGVYAAMLAGGLAITIKQTTAFEAAFLGAYTVFVIRSGKGGWRSALPAATVFLFLGTAPTILISIWYWQAGHWPEFFNAMVTSNFRKSGEALEYKLDRIISLVSTTAPLLGFAFLSLKFHVRDAKMRPWLGFLLGWLTASFVGFCIIPNFFLHYALPVAVPLTIIAAPFLNRRDFGFYSAVPAVVLLAWAGQPFNISRHVASQRNMTELARGMRDHAPRPTALVFDAPPYLYALSGLKPLSPLVFPNHFNQLTELNVSYLDTEAELSRVLAEKPAVVAISSGPRSYNYNPKTWRMVETYVRSSCKFIMQRHTYEMHRDDLIWIFGDCH